MNEIITYHLSATGIWRYEFCRDGESIGHVASAGSPREPVRIEGPQPNLYEVRTREKSIQAEIRNGCYLFGAPFMPVTAMTERAEGGTRLVRGMDAPMLFRTRFFDPVSDAYVMMALTFPALRFC